MSQKRHSRLVFIIFLVFSLFASACTSSEDPNALDPTIVSNGAEDPQVLNDDFKTLEVDNVFEKVILVEGDKSDDPIEDDPELSEPEEEAEPEEETPPAEETPEVPEPTTPPTQAPPPVTLPPLDQGANPEVMSITAKASDSGNLTFSTVIRCESSKVRIIASYRRTPLPQGNTIRTLLAEKDCVDGKASYSGSFPNSTNLSYWVEIAVRNTSGNIKQRGARTVEINEFNKDFGCMNEHTINGHTYC